MHIGNKIKNLVEAQKGVKNTDFAAKIGYTEQGLYAIFRKEHLRTDVLENICNALNITLSDFFSNDRSFDKQKTAKAKPSVYFDLEDSEILRVDLKNKRLEILKK
ncbi:MAG: helix-turn-helix transcriptional regulator [Bacteroidetes bacterium]|nr:helix-turn-helix transcriptional regulator [Bacteroidota bacterium]